MKNALSICIALSFAAVSVSAQNNLVPNGDFESLIKIPTGYLGPGGEMERTINDWHQGATSSADIVSTKATSAPFKITNQQPHSGSTMAHIICGTSTSWVEYISASLTRPLTPGKRYYVEAYVLLLESSGAATNNLGFFFNTGECTPTQQNWRTDEPQVRCDSFITDQKHWTKISGYFTASAAYTTITFGNFITPYTEFRTLPNSTTAYGNGNCRYYVDDITVRTAGDLVATGDTLVNVGAKATFTAKGGTTYSWVDVRQPKVVLGTGSVLTIAVNKKTTFRVTSGEDEVELTVNVRKVGPVYTETLNGRKVRKGRTVNVSHEEVTVSIHDKNEVDGDSVSLYYGDSLVCQHVSLTKKKQSFTIKVDKLYPKQLILYAENLGSVPPNTAELTVKDGKNSTDIVLGSDFKWCDSIMLVYKEDD